MRKFEWARVGSQRDEDGTPIQLLSLLEILNNGKSRKFWASIKLFPHMRGEEYIFVAYNKYRVLQLPEPNGAKTIEEAQEAIEAYLMSEGIIEDGDIVEYLE